MNRIFNSKITLRLIGYFLLFLIIFSLLLSIMFYYRGSIALKEQYGNYLKGKAETIAKSIKDYPELLENESMMKNHTSMGKGMGMGRKYLEVMRNLLKSDVYILNDKGQILTDTNNSTPNLEISPVNNSVTKVETNLNYHVDLIIKDSTLVNSGYHFDEDDYITAFSRLKYSNGSNGFVLIRDTADNIGEILKSSITLFFFILIIAMILMIFLSAFLAGNFVKPVIKLDKMASTLKEGDYSIRSDIHSNDELGVLAASMDELAGRLGQVEKERDNLETMRRDFIASTSHELKTPVAVLKGITESLKDGVINNPKDVQQSYITMEREVNTLEVLIKDLMELTSLKNPSYPIELWEVSLENIIEDSIRSAKKLKKERDVEIIHEKSQDEIIIKGDYLRLKQLITILLDNAIKYSKGGNPIIIKEENDPFKVTIINQGEIIDKNNLENIFKPFFQVNPTSQGKGLGLAIGQEIASRHGMVIKVESSNGYTKFIITYKII